MVGRRRTIHSTRYEVATPTVKLAASTCWIRVLTWRSFKLSRTRLKLKHLTVRQLPLKFFPPTTPSASPRQGTMLTRPDSRPQIVGTLHWVPVKQVEQSCTGLMPVSSKTLCQLNIFLTCPHSPYPPLKERDTAFDYRYYWITIQGSPILTHCHLLLRPWWLTFIPFNMNLLFKLAYKTFSSLVRSLLKTHLRV